MRNNNLTRFQKRKLDSLDRLSKNPLALKYIPKEFVDLTEINDFQLNYDGKREQIEKISGAWEVNIYSLAEDAYWGTRDFADDQGRYADVIFNMEIDLGHINSRHELDNWQKELKKKYPKLMKVYLEYETGDKNKVGYKTLQTLLKSSKKVKSNTNNLKQTKMTNSKLVKMSRGV